MKRLSSAASGLGVARLNLRIEPLETRSLMVADFSGLQIWELSEDRIQHHRLEGPSEFRSTSLGKTSNDNLDSTELRFSLQVNRLPESMDVGRNATMEPPSPVIVVHGPVRSDTLAVPQGISERSAFGPVPVDSIAIIVPQPLTTAPQAGSPRYTLFLLSKNPRSIVLPIGGGTSLLVNSVPRTPFQNMPNNLASALPRETVFSTVDAGARSEQASKEIGSSLAVKDKTGTSQHLAQSKVAEFQSQLDRAVPTISVTEATTIQIEPASQSAMDVVFDNYAQPDFNDIPLDGSTELSNALTLPLERQRNGEASRLQAAWLKYVGTTQENPVRFKGDFNTGIKRMDDSLPIPNGMIPLSYTRGEQQQAAFFEDWLAASFNPMAALQVFLRSDSTGAEPSWVEGTQANDQPQGEILEQAREHSRPIWPVAGGLVALLWALLVARPFHSPGNDPPMSTPVLRSHPERKKSAWL